MKMWITLGLLLLAVAGEARTLLVSDVDDTLKLAHVKDLTEAARFAFDSESRFTGMSQLYHLIKKDQPDLEIYYLSRAPEWFMARTHRKFLANGQFPEGEYIGKTDYASETHKLYKLREIMARVRPNKVIFVGDNGEHDAQVYQQIAHEFAAPGVEFHQFIRIVYSQRGFVPQVAPVNPGQTGFVTPVEIALELEKAGVVSTSSVQWLVAHVVPQLVYHKSWAEEDDDYEIAFPYFVNCRDFVWKWDESLRRFESLNVLKNRIVNRCKIRP